MGDIVSTVRKDGTGAIDDAYTVAELIEVLSNYAPDTEVCRRFDAWAVETVSGVIEHKHTDGTRWLELF